MAITAQDVLLRQAERMADTSDGGGAMVAALVVDGQMNNVFPDISDTERLFGKSRPRKLFAHIASANRDTAYGTFVALTGIPQDDNVGAVLIKATAFADERDAIKNRIESYQIQSIESRFTLFGDHPQGMRTVQMYCMSDAPTPEVNDLFVLSVEAPGYVANKQFVRVLKIISRETRTFVDATGSFQRDVVRFEMYSPLVHDFVGQEPSRFTSTKPPTRIRETTVADAADFKGCKPLAVSAAIGDTRIKVASPYVPIVPGAQVESPLVDQLATLGTIQLVPSGAAASLSFGGSIAGAAGELVTRYFGSSIARGSVSVTIAGVVFTDGADGALVTTGAASGYSGSVDHVTGSVTITRDQPFSASVSATAQPAGPVAGQSFTQSIEITQNNRGYSYTAALSPRPSPGTVLIEYQALGKWIRLSDNSRGAAIGESGQGTATINYATGSISMSLGALPDVGSAVLVKWGTPTIAQDRSGDVAIQPGNISHKLGVTGVRTLTITWTSGGTQRTATMSATGALTGDVTSGRVVSATGELYFSTTLLPDANTTINFSGTRQDEQTEVFNGLSDPAGQVNFTLASDKRPVRPGTFRASFAVLETAGDTGAGATRTTISEWVFDDGFGALLNARGGAAVGTIDYSTGAITLTTGRSYSVRFPQYETIRTRWGWSYQRLTGYGTANTTVSLSGGSISANWLKDVAGGDNFSEQIGAPPLEFDLTPTVLDTVVAGSVRVTYRGRTYVDRNGLLYYGVSATTNAGTQGGTINYQTGRCVLTDYATGSGLAIVVPSLLTVFKEPGVSGLFGRTPGRPIKPGAFTIRATTLDGREIVGSANINGEISGTEITGTIDWTSGVFYVGFGQMVTAAGNESQPWYNAAWIVGGQIFRPTQCIPATINFNTVAYRSVPTDPVAIGIDGTRLPSDGRVVVFKAGDGLLIHNEQSISVASPTANQVVNCGRTRLSDVRVVDSLGAAVNSSNYTINKVAGTVTFAPVLSLGGLTLPIIIRHTVMDLRQCVDVQITGELDLATPLSHVFASGTSLVSSIMLFDDLQSRVTGIFDQATWNGAWADTVQGSAALATYDDQNYPIAVLNRDAITERWALIFTGSNNYNVVGESRGLIGTGTTIEDCAPINPVSGQPYFVLDKDGWGGGWSTGNVLRFNTLGSVGPFWALRVVLPSDAEVEADWLRLLVYCNAN